MTEKEFIKCSVVGGPRAGTTWIIRSYSENWTRDGLPDFPEWPLSYMPEVDLLIDGKSCRMLIYDIPSPDDYDRLKPLCYDDTDIVLLCYSMDNPESYEMVASKWYQEIRFYCPHVPIILVATTCDALTDKEFDAHPLYYKNPAGPLTRMDGCRLREEIGALKLMECSGKTGFGLEEVFREAARTVLSRDSSRKKHESWFNKLPKLFK